VLTLLGVGFLGGLITGLSPCVVPVLPVIMAGGSTSGNRARPYAIIAGLILSFCVATLAGASLLRALHLPDDVLNDLGLALLFALALGLLIPRVGELMERPFARLGASRHLETSSGFVLGISLGLVFVPCAGPVLTAISAVVANHRIGATSVFLILAYALGAGIPLLILSLLSQRATLTWKRLRGKTPLIRQVAGAVVGLMALAIALNLTQPFQTSLSGYASTLESHIEGSGSVSSQLRALTGEGVNKFTSTMASSVNLPDLGRAPQFTGITTWLNTPGDQPLSLKQLRGKVVLVDFWTYSCINCERSLPHVEAWYANYKKDGLVVVGVHTPEFAFEHVVSNVKAAAARLGVRYPIAVDNNYGTWDAYNNNSWPAEYLIDQNGNVRYATVGEGDYSTTEKDIRLLLQAGGASQLPPATEVANRTPTEATTVESYLGYQRLQNYVGSAIVNGKPTNYTPPASIPPNTLTYRGTWTVNSQEITSTNGSQIEFWIQADDVYLVLGGTGTIQVSANGKHLETINVAGEPDLYTIVSGTHFKSETLTMTFSSGIEAYDFTFG
jgi:cytochrome c biogenesis protein CcdA/thiol-disulfide isomerase/thioredoxin